MKDVTKNKFMQVIKETRELLEKNNEWRGRYAGYAKEISDKIDAIRSVRSSFHEWSPLKVYLNTTSAKTAKHSVSFELRYMGQTVAKLTVNKGEIPKLSTRYKYCEEANLHNFNCSIRLPDADWRGEDAKEFRRFFKKREVTRVDDKRGNKEHYLESLLLTEFSKTKSEEKPLLRIQPVTIAKVRFPMPTPISASRHRNLKYSGPHDGHVDILARTGVSGKATHLCIMELKNKNTKSEPPRDAMKQAVAYATFIRELLRSDAGADWWKLFGFRGEIPEPLEMYAACVMRTRSNEDKDKSFGEMELDIDGDIIKLHYLYFKEENNKISIKPEDTSLWLT